MSKDTLDFAEWIHKNAKPIKNNDPFKWAVKLKGLPVIEYCTTKELYEKYKNGK